MRPFRALSSLAILAVAACAGEVESPTAPTPPTDGPSLSIIAGSGTWGTRASMPFPQQQHAVGSAAGHLYTIGGFDDNFNLLALVQEYTPATDSWRSIAPLPNAVHDPMTATIGTKLYVLGGCDNGIGPRTYLLYYHASIDTWEPLALMNAGRCHSPTAVVGGRIYVFGNASGPDSTSSEVYDASLNMWFPITSIPAYGGANSYARTAQAIGGKIYVYQMVGGAKRLDIYDPAFDSWSSGAVPGGPVPFQFVTGVVAGKLYELQNHDPFHTLNFGYDPVTDQWTAVADDPYSLNNTAAATIGRVIYQAGGQFSTHAVGTVYTFTPAFAGNHLPDVMFNMSRATEGVAVHFDATTTTDADGDPLTYVWSFGDGGVATGTNPTHTYFENGSYSVTLTVDDGVGCDAPGSCQLTKSLTVVNARPVFGSGFVSTTAVVGTPYIVSSTFSDPGLSDTWTATVNYGDGGGVQALPLFGQTFFLGHTYSAPGAFDVTVTITDDDGGVRAATRRIRVTH